LLRGTGGTAASIHSVGSAVYDMGRGNILPVQFQNYIDSDITYGDGTTTEYVTNIELSSTGNNWDPAYIGSPGLELSNNDLTVTATVEILNNNEPTVLNTYAIEPGEQVMFSVTQNVWAPQTDYSGIGLGTHVMDINDYLGADTNSIGFWDTGKLYYDGTSNSGYPTFQYDGAVLDLAVDRVNELMWLRVDGGEWNNDPLSDPATATGGVDISGAPSALYPGVCPYWDSGIAGQMTINSSATYGVPAGFTLLTQDYNTTCVEVYVGGIRITEGYTVTANPVIISFDEAPAAGLEITILVRRGVTWYAPGNGTPSNGIALQDTYTQAARFLRGLT